LTAPVFKHKYKAKEKRGLSLTNTVSYLIEGSSMKKNIFIVNTWIETNIAVPSFHPGIDVMKNFFTAAK